MMAFASSIDMLVPKLPLPVEPLEISGWFHAVIGTPVVKSLLPFPILTALAFGAWFFFKNTWRQLEAEAAAERATAPPDQLDLRPAVCLVLVAAILTIQEYYGGRAVYETMIRPELQGLEQWGWSWLKTHKYDQLYSYAWWASARIVGYVFVPIVVWKLCFRKEKILDYGLRVTGFVDHLWLYGVLFALIIPVMLTVAHQPDFGSYYPFYKLSSRSWFDFLVWEAMYYLQFFALEFFFRGWMIGALRRLGTVAIFAMAVPYCMIHYGKPYLEAHGAIVAGVVLGTLSMKTRSIYGGFLLHVSVAAGMDVLSLYKRNELPNVFWAAG
jgi:membrane protease YdiL (CAAX protease family)